MLLGLCFCSPAPRRFGLNGYGLYLLTLTGIFALVALGLNLLTGYAGQISLCHAVLLRGRRLRHRDPDPEGGIALSAVAFRRRAAHDRDRSASSAVPALRLKNLYLAIATLGFGVVLQKIIFEWRGLTGGGGGLALTPAQPSPDTNSARPGSII